MSNNLHLVTGYAGEEHVTSADMGSYNAAMLGNGEYVLERGNKFAASIISNNKVKVLDGDLMMQGRHVRLNENTYVELDFDNGTQGYKRNDLIVARYTKDNTTGVESCNLVVIKGTPSTSAASDPAYTTGDIINDHVEVNDMPLYRVPFDGLNMQPLECMFLLLPTWKKLQDNALNNISNQWESKKEQIDQNLLSIAINSLDEIKTNTDSDKIAGALAVKELFQHVSDGKSLVASAITDKGVATDATDTFATMANNIRSIQTGTDIDIRGISSDSITSENGFAILTQGKTNMKISRLSYHGGVLYDENTESTILFEGGVQIYGDNKLLKTYKTSSTSDQYELNINIDVSNYNSICLKNVSGVDGGGIINTYPHYDINVLTLS